mgnify:CR=1 FL=1
MCYPVHPVLLESPSSPPQVVLPPPHQSRIAGRVRSHLPQWKKISGPMHTKDHHGRYPHAMGSGSAPIQSPLRFCDLSAKSLKRIRRLQQDTSALSRNRLRGPITKSGRDGWSLVNIPHGGKEGHGQASGMHRFAGDKPLLEVRALQDGGAAHSSAAHPPQRPYHEDRPERLLHALPHRQGRPPVHAVHVGGQEVRVHRHAIRPGSSSETGHQDDGPGNPLSSIVRPSSSHLYRRSNFAVPFLQGEHSSYSIVGGYPTQPRLHYSSRQGTSDPLPIGRVFGHTREQQEDAVPSASRQDPVDSARDQKCLPGKRHRHPHRRR